MPGERSLPSLSLSVLFPLLHLGKPEADREKERERERRGERYDGIR